MNAAHIIARCVRVGDCLIWTGATAKGYGRITIQQRVYQTHRVVYEELVRPLAEWETIDHLCFNRACQNIDHMDPCSRGENARRGADRNPTVIRNRAKTHCPQGHPYSPENTYIMSSGSRFCRTCGRAATKAWRERKLYA